MGLLGQLLFLFLVGSASQAAEVSITVDDLRTNDRKILKALRAHNLQAALFVCGMRVDSPEGREILGAWSDDGHIIANHSYSHKYFHSKTVTLKDFEDDFLRNEPLITSLKGFRPLFRFPYLKEGDTREKRDGFREFLKARGYKMGYVTIDASDWYISDRLEKRLQQNPKADLTSFRDYYLRHIWDRARYYDSLAKRALGREIKHTLLIHDNLLNHLFLPDLLKMFKDKGWKLIDASEAFADPVFSATPDILPAGESIVWAIAKESGKFERELRYPAEDGRYEKEEMDRRGL